MTSPIVHAKIERLISIDRGRDVILCDHTDRSLGPNGGEALLRMSVSSLRCLRAEIDEVLEIAAGRP